MQDGSPRSASNASRSQSVDMPETPFRASRFSSSTMAVDGSFRLVYMLLNWLADLQNTIAKRDAGLGIGPQSHSLTNGTISERQNRHDYTFYKSVARLRSASNSRTRRPQATITRLIMSANQFENVSVTRPPRHIKMSKSGWLCCIRHARTFKSFDVLASQAYGCATLQGWRIHNHSKDSVPCVIIVANVSSIVHESIFVGILGSHGCVYMPSAGISRFKIQPSSAALMWLYANPTYTSTRAILHTRAD